MSASQVVQGFSLTNRWLLYASMMLAPAQYAGGLGNNIPTNFGFLAYNWYTQVQWYQAVKAKELHALSLLPIHFNVMYAFSYFGGISSGNIFMSILLGLGTVGVLLLNTIAAWVSWATNQPEGFGEYQFFFFGWRTLSHGCCTIGAVRLIAITKAAEVEDPHELPWYCRKYPDIPMGAILMLISEWSLILWTGLIIQGNHIVSETDMIAVWLFVAQVGTLLIPSWSSMRRLLRGSQESA